SNVPAGRSFRPARSSIRTLACARLLAPPGSASPTRHRRLIAIQAQAPTEDELRFALDFLSLIGKLPISDRHRGAASRDPGGVDRRHRLGAGPRPRHRRRLASCAGPPGWHPPTRALLVLR